MDASHVETSKTEHAKINKGSMHLDDQAKLISRRYVNISYLCTYLSVLTGSICDGSFEVAAVVAWSHMVVEDSSMLMQAKAEGDT